VPSLVLALSTSFSIIKHTTFLIYLANPNSLSNLNECEANLFAIALLFDPSLFIFDIQRMVNYILKAILDHNVNYS
jgi:hypothetical protein